VEVVLVVEAAQQPPAGTGNLDRVEREVLVFGDRQADGAQLGQPAGATVLPTAAPDAGEAPRFVARADLTQLDARPEQARQVAHQGPEVDPLLGREIDREFAAVPLPFRVGDLHGEAVVAHALAGLATGVFGGTLQLRRRRHLLSRGAAQDAPGRFRLRFRNAAAPAPAAAFLEGDRVQRRDPAEILA